MSWLLDTNVISELRKRERAAPEVRAWFDGVSARDLFTSVLVVGELAYGVESARRRDPAKAEALEQWLARMVESFADRILPVDVEVAERWAKIRVPDPVPTVDGLIAATALVHDLTLVTRNVQDVARTGATILNPFAPV